MKINKIIDIILTYMEETVASTIECYISISVTI